MVRRGVVVRVAVVAVVDNGAERGDADLARLKGQRSTRGVDSDAQELVIEADRTVISAGGPHRSRAEFFHRPSPPAEAIEFGHPGQGQHGRRLGDAHPHNAIGSNLGLGIQVSLDLFHQKVLAAIRIGVHFDVETVVGFADVDGVDERLPVRLTPNLPEHGGQLMGRQRRIEQHGGTYLKHL